tara:strand:+ start:570 stop:725 length:156 start_codon:yes stop_codon:yes gene_type:complete
MLEKASQELDTGNPLDPPSIVVTVLPAEGHMRVIHAENPRIADRRPKDVPR